MFGHAKPRQLPELATFCVTSPVHRIASGFVVYSTLEQSGLRDKQRTEPWEMQSLRCRVNLLISDTGGGHRACAQALREALLLRAPHLDIAVVDGLRETGRYPLDRMPELYTRWSEKRNLWRTTFHLSNGRRLSNALFYPWQKFSARQLRAAILRGNPALVVNMHPCLAASSIYFAKRAPVRPRVATVVTDLIYGHASWFQHGADDYFVPTDIMARRAHRMGIPDDKIHLSGLPLAARLSSLSCNRDTLRQDLGFHQPTVVCVGGADGMGIQRIASALTQIPPHISVHIVCGKNTSLQDSLLGRQLPQNFTIHGFSKQLPEMLAAADLALIKASPTVLMEALSVGTFVLLYDYVPGQESGNVRFVREHGLGDYSRSPRTIVSKIIDYLGQGERPIPPSLGSILPLDGAGFISERLLQDLLFQHGEGVPSIAREHPGR